MNEFVRAWKSGKPQRSARIGFATPELLGPVSIREAARRVERDVKAVHSDVTALLSAGLLNRTDTGSIEFPYEAVKVEFLLHAA